MLVNVTEKCSFLFKSGFMCITCQVDLKAFNQEFWHLNIYIFFTVLSVLFF